MKPSLRRHVLNRDMGKHGVRSTSGAMMNMCINSSPSHPSDMKQIKYITCYMLSLVVWRAARGFCTDGPPSVCVDTRCKLQQWIRIRRPIGGCNAGCSAAGTGCTDNMLRSLRLQSLATGHGFLGPGLSPPSWPPATKPCLSTLVL